MGMLLKLAAHAQVTPNATALAWKGGRLGYAALAHEVETLSRERTLEPGIAQAAVFGEARPWNTAVLVPGPGVAAASLAAVVERANRELPDYARVSRWIVADAPFTPNNGQLSGTGRVRRHSIYQYYRAPIERLYSEEMAS